MTPCANDLRFTSDDPFDRAEAAVVERWACGSPKQYYDKVCPRCDVEFVTTAHKRKYCSELCRKANRPILDRFWRQVAVAGPDECWLWTGEVNNKGYGKFAIEHAPRIRVYSHRFSFEVANAEDARGLVVMHSCDNPPCCNPAHLSLGTQKDNMQDAKAKGRLNPGGLLLGQRMSTREARLRKAS